MLPRSCSRGNVVGSTTTPYKIGDTCGNCPDACDNGLCSTASSHIPVTWPMYQQEATVLRPSLPAPGPIAVADGSGKEQQRKNSILFIALLDACVFFSPIPASMNIHSPTVVN
ncbi:unnamed protein product [Lepidochelys olivacea]